MGKLVIDGNSVYEIDEECLRRRETQEKQQREKSQEYTSVEIMSYKKQK